MSENRVDFEYLNEISEIAGTELFDDAFQETEKYVMLKLDNGRRFLIT